MKKPMKKFKRFNTGGSANDYKGTDEMVQYRMGQIKDPGVDLFKLASGEEQEAKPVPLKKPEAAPTPAKTEAESAKAEPAKTTPVKLASNINPEDGKEYTPVDQAAPYKDARLVSAPPIRKPPKPVVRAETKTETKVEPKAEAKAEAKAEPKDDKPVPAKVTKDEKPKTGPKTPGALAFTDEERAKNRSRLYEGIKSIFSGPADYITKGSPKMRAKEALKSGMASKDRDTMRKGGSVKMASGGKVSSASKRADGCAVRGKTRA